ncbi:MAG: PfkB family carbohydrate kinase [Ignavibacteria bacterium]|jgi:sugar/nucleoside kinase (ribokinase family)
MKLLVIGHSVVDEINFRNKKKVQPGGIFYTIMGLCNLKNEKDEIFLMTSFDGKSGLLFDEYFSKVNLSYSQKVKEVPRVNLTIYENEERRECYLSSTNKLTIDKNITFENFDGILINMITGFDIDLDDLIFIRSKFDGPIYFDIHTFSRGMNENGVRKFRKIPFADDWIRYLNIIQCNEKEVFCLSELKNEKEIASQIIKSADKNLLVTKAEGGVTGYFFEDNFVSEISIPAIETDINNKVGCGDIFGAVFFYSYIGTKNFRLSLERANIAGGLTAEYKSINDFKKLKKDIDDRLN